MVRSISYVFKFFVNLNSPFVTVTIRYGIEPFAFHTFNSIENWRFIFIFDVVSLIYEVISVFDSKFKINISSFIELELSKIFDLVYKPINKVVSLLTSLADPTFTKSVLKILFSTNFYRFLFTLYVPKPLLLIFHVVTLGYSLSIQIVYKCFKKFDATRD